LPFSILQGLVLTFNIGAYIHIVMRNNILYVCELYFCHTNMIKLVHYRSNDFIY
jgi:hypothetical protein